MIKHNYIALCFVEGHFVLGGPANKRIDVLLEASLIGLVFTLTYISVSSAYRLTLQVTELGPSGQNHADSAGDPRGWWFLVEGIHVEIWVVSETRIHSEIQGNFQILVEMRGMFSQTCKHFNSPKKDIKSSLGYFHTIQNFTQL